MPPKDIKLGPGTVYFQTPEGPQPLGSITEAPAIEAEEPGWAEDVSVVIKAAQEPSTFTAEVKINPDVAKAANEAPPRVRHLAQHGKKYRTRKKNINRALREYQRRSRKRDRTRTNTN